jgi:serine protease SohB
VQTTLTVLETIFLILSIVVVLAVLAAVVVLALRILSANRAEREERPSDLQTTDLGKQLTERANRVKRSLMPKKERKELAKRSKNEIKTEKYDSTVFVIDFRPKLRAREVETLRKEVDVITQLATPRDEVVVRIDSPGGTVTGYGHAASQLLRIHNIGVPLTICVDEIAASGGYMCAAVADKIIAAPFAFIGSIGVVAGIPNFVGLMNKIGVRYFELTAGENKRTLSPFAEPTPEKQAVEQQRLEAIHRAFKQLIKERRPNLDIDRVADGNYWLAVDAKELGLVDMIQTSDEYLVQQAKANRRILKISCERRTHKILSNLLDSFGAD